MIKRCCPDCASVLKKHRWWITRPGRTPFTTFPKGPGAGGAPTRTIIVKRAITLAMTEHMGLDAECVAKHLPNLYS